MLTAVSAGVTAGSWFLYLYEKVREARRRDLSGPARTRRLIGRFSRPVRWGAACTALPKASSPGDGFSAGPPRTSLRAAALAGAVACCLLSVSARGSVRGPVVIGLLCVLAGVATPRVLDTLRRESARKHVERSLPEVIDLMTVCTDAGMSVYSALKYAAGACGGPLGNELKRAVSAMSAGSSLEDALRNIASLCDLPSLRFFATTLVRSHAQGNPLSEVLKGQAWVVRQQRRLALEARMRAMPVKIAVCSVVFFLPAVLVVSVLPGVLLFLRSRW
jgi:tight adherence protein C